MTTERKFSETNDEMIRRSSAWMDLNVRPSHDKEHGCPLGCIYCNQMSLDRGPSGEKEAGYLFQGVDSAVSLNTKLMSGSEVIKQISVDDLFKELKTYPHYNPNSPFLIENFNDPGLNWKQSIDIADRLREEVGHTGPSIFITKMPISDKNATKMEEFKQSGGKPIVIVTYSGLPAEIEPASGRKRVDTLRKLSEKGVPTILSMRPMIDGLNITEENIRKIAEETGNYVSAITVGGLFVYQPDTIENFRKAGFELGELYKNHTYAPAKVLPPYTKRRVRGIMKEEGVRANVHDHTSCAVAEICTNVYGNPTADRLAHWAGGEQADFDYCKTKCSTTQVEVCNSASKVNTEIVVEKAEKELRKLGYDNHVLPSVTQAGLLLVKDGSLTIGELFTLTEQTGWQVNNWPSKEGVIYRTKQAVTEDLGLPDKVILGAVPVGQEWYVVLDGDIDGKGNSLAVKWIRSRNRARIQVLDVKELDDKNFERSVDRLSSVSHGIQSRDDIKGSLQEIIDRGTYDLGE
jgi:DNA repair photolyase